MSSRPATPTNSSPRMVRRRWPSCATVMREGPVTLVTAARDLDGSHVAVLAGLLS